MKRRWIEGTGGETRSISFNSMLLIGEEDYFIYFFLLGWDGGGGGGCETIHSQVEIRTRSLCNLDSNHFISTHG